MNITKNLMIAAASALVFAACKDSAAPAAPQATAEASNEVAATGKLETASFSIEGMSCSVGCAKTIEKKLAGLEGVQSAKVDYDAKTATVEYDTAKQSPEKLAATVEAAADGKTYKVSDVKSSGDKAMVYGDPVKDKKKKKKAKKGAEEAAATTDAEAKPAGKGCCAGKKACSSSEKATM